MKNKIIKLSGRASKSFLNSDKEALARLVDIHLKSFDHNELSSILGRQVVTEFYKQISLTDDARISLFFYKSELVGFLVYFTNYKKFKSSFSALKLFWLLDYFKVLRNFYKIINHYYCGTKETEIPKNIYNRYLGAVAIQSDDHIKMDVFQAILSHYKDVVRINLKNKCWGSCRSDNKVARMLLQSCGLTLTREYGYLPKICIFEINR